MDTSYLNHAGQRDFRGRGIKHCRQDIADLKNEGQAILAASDRESRQLTAEDKTRLETIKTKLASLDMERIQMEKELEHERNDVPVLFRTGNADPPEPGPITSAGKRTYQALFGRLPGFTLTNDNWKSFGEMTDVIRLRQTDSRLKYQALAAVNERTGSEGGFAVPSEYAKEIFDIALQESIVLQRAKLYPMASDSKKIPAVSIEAHSASIGGVTFGWTAEGGTITPSTPKFRSEELIARKLAGYTTLSNEWFEDAISSGEFIAQAFGKAAGWYLDKAFLTGPGAGQPIGVKTSPCLITVAKATNQVAATIVYSNLCAMEARLNVGSHERAIWVAHPGTLPELREISLPVGTGGSVVGALEGTFATGFTLMGYPLKFSEHMSTLGSAFDIALMDLTQYAVGLRRELLIDASIHVGFSTDEQAWRAKFRGNGLPLWDKTLTLADGSTTVSPFVTLAERV